VKTDAHLIFQLTHPLKYWI